MGGGEKQAFRLACRKWLCETYGNGNDYPMISDSESESGRTEQKDIRCFMSPGWSVAYLGTGDANNTLIYT
jgi:hypothetical protein